MNNLINKSVIKCDNCGGECKNESPQADGRSFCCNACKSAYEIMNGNDMCNCNSKEEHMKTPVKEKEINSKFDYLDDKDILTGIIDFTNKNITSVTFFIPSIHCASCIQFLEKLYKINSNILSSKVNFLEKNLSLTYDNSAVSLKTVVEILTSLGYEPLINLDSGGEKNKNNSYTKKLYTKVGVAGFCLGNIMLLSFPEYLSVNNFIEGNIKTLFNYLNILLSLPVFFYCASDYFSSAWKGLKKKFINIDFPISLGLTALFFRSLYEIIYFNNPGFSDSLAGLVFLLLLGKLFQSKTYSTLNFERDYKSYFPLSVTLKKDGLLKSVSITAIKSGDRVVIRNNEIIPADGILFSGTANIDYSFVTGESIPEQKVLGEIIYAGGRHKGSAIEIEVIRTVSRSYLTQLWNDKAFEKKSGSDSNIQSLANSVSKYFTAAVLLIAFGAAFYWLDKDINLALNAFTTVLIVACPCAFALTTPFALGNSLRILGRNKFYLKNAGVVEDISKINSIVFDKTGTITNTNDMSVKFTGSELTLCEFSLVKSLVRNSLHPLSKRIYDSIKIKENYEVDNFSESLSEGIEGVIRGRKLKLGSIRFIVDEFDCSYTKLKKEICSYSHTTNVYLSVDSRIKGFFSFNNKYREGLESLVDGLSVNHELSVISGDNNYERNNLKKIFKKDSEGSFLFNQSPSEKLNFIKSVQKDGKKVMMIGDGLNDAGALKQSDVGISVSEDVMNFTPACDGIIEASRFSRTWKIY